MNAPLLTGAPTVSYADDVMDGIFCERCFSFIGPTIGHARTCHSCRQEDRAALKRQKMEEAQLKELTSSMTVYNNETHVIRITEERNGMLTCTVRNRQRKDQGVDVTITFPKKNKQGVVWTYLSVDRLSVLAFDSNHAGIRQ